MHLQVFDFDILMLMKVAFAPLLIPHRALFAVDGKLE